MDAIRVQIIKGSRRQQADGFEWFYVHSQADGPVAK